MQDCVSLSRLPSFSISRFRSYKSWSFRESGEVGSGSLYYRVVRRDGLVEVSIWMLVRRGGDVDFSAAGFLTKKRGFMI